MGTMYKLCFCLKSKEVRGEDQGDVHLDEHYKCLDIIGEETCKGCGYNKK